MGFFKDVGKAIGKVAEIAVMPVTAPLDILAKANIPVVSQGARGVSEGTKIVSTAFSGRSVSDSLKSAAGDILPAASAAAGIPGLNISGLGFDSSMISGLTDIFGNNPAGTVNPVPGAATYQSPAPATPMRGAPQSDFLTPALVIGGAGIVAYLLFRGKK